MGKKYSEVTELGETKRCNFKKSNETTSLRWVSLRLKKITQKVLQRKIYKNLILNFDQTPLGFTFPAKTTFTEKNPEI